MKNWDPNKFQGKSRLNVETSYRIIAACLIIGILIITWGFFIELIKLIF